MSDRAPATALQLADIERMRQMMEQSPQTIRMPHVSRRERIDNLFDSSDENTRITMTAAQYRDMFGNVPVNDGSITVARQVHTAPLLSVNVDYAASTTPVTAHSHIQRREVILYDEHD